ncbi:uncharacterized protein TEOVI_000765300 [Trypanosoma equiperdum]|uniref:Uncharacterized protein n=1 Tax=Trypanosoma equiperdum TaxID=5694 RepID=A0A1G4HZX2_TRYEQ|nr:hypothetical protein, conserved [Trypanosoma equiperdum]
MALTLIPRCLQFCTRHAFPSLTRGPVTPMLWYSTGKKEGTSRGSGKGKTSSKKKRKSEGNSKKVRKEPDAGESTVPCVPTTPDVVSQPTASPQIVEKIKETCSSTSSWCPTTQDYEALIVDMLLYRQETVEAVVDALRKERLLLDESIKRMEEHIADVYLVREEIREMLQESAAVQKQMLSDALQLIGEKCKDVESAVDGGSSGIVPAEVTADNAENDDDGEIIF